MALGRRLPHQLRLALGLPWLTRPLSSNATPLGPTPYSLTPRPDPRSDCASELLASLSSAELARAGTHPEHGRYGVDTWLEIYAEHAHEHAEQMRTTVGLGFSSA